MAIPVADLTGRNIELVHFGWFDFVGDPVRATTLPGGYTFGASETGDADLDGDTFDWVPGGVVSISEVTHTSGGSGSVDVTLSGLVGPDNDLLNMLATSSNWRGRVGRLWHGTAVSGALNLISPYYTGYMVNAVLAGSPDGGQRVTVTLESYAVMLTQARNRTYQDQGLYDSGDESPARIRAAANGATGTAIIPANGGGGMRFDDRQYVDTQ
jgi:hypothetical protein